MSRTKTVKGVDYITIFRTNSVKKSKVYEIMTAHGGAASALRHGVFCPDGHSLPLRLLNNCSVFISFYSPHFTLILTGDTSRKCKCWLSTNRPFRQMTLPRRIYERHQATCTQRDPEGMNPRDLSGRMILYVVAY